MWLILLNMHDSLDFSYDSIIVSESTSTKDMTNFLYQKNLHEFDGQMTCSVECKNDKYMWME
jgi:hypothetical protein